MRFLRKTSEQVDEWGALVASDITDFATAVAALGGGGGTVLPTPTTGDENRAVRVNGTHTAYELGNRNAAAGWPAYAPVGLTRQYNPDWCAYGLTNTLMAPQRLSMAMAACGLGAFHWLIPGDSLSAEYMGSGATKPNDPSAAWPYIARDQLRAAGVALGGTGFVSPNQNLDPANAGDDYDPRWALSSGWNTHNYGLYAVATVAGETAVFTSDVDGCTDIAFPIDDKFADCAYVIKDSLGATLTSGNFGPAGTSTIRLFHYAGIDVHSIAITTPVGTNSTSNKARIYPVNIYKSTGMQIHNLSFVSAIGVGASGWENTGAVYNGADKIALLCVPNPDLLTIMLGGNDRFNSYTDSVISTGITNLFNKWSGNITKIFIGHTQAASWSDATMASFTAAYWSMCEAGGFGFVDAHAFSGGYTLMNAKGVIQDAGGGQTHPNQVWAQTLGRLFGQILRTTPSTEGLQDVVAQTLVSGANVTLTYNDVTGKITVSAAGGGGGGAGWTGYGVWAGSSAYTAGDLVELPTGGLGYRTATGTSAATWTAAERDAWTFLPGGHYEKLSATGAGTWKCPVGIVQAQFRLKGAGGSGGGGASAATGIAQAGGSGGGAADPLDFVAAVAAGTSYTTAVPVASTGGNGGVAGGNLGTAGAAGGDATIIIGGVTYTSKGGGGGSRSTVGNNTGQNGGAYGFASAVAGPATFYPGAGGYGGAAAIGCIPLAGVIGGTAGASSSTTLGGNGGNARTAPGAGLAAPAGNTGTTAGAAGTAATEYGCGGGGGGGGTNATGAGGAGGAGAQGVIEVRF